jgi:hypothetical protein
MGHQVLAAKPEKISHEDESNMHLEETGSEVVDWINVTWDTNRWRNTMSTLESKHISLT